MNHLSQSIKILQNIQEDIKCNQQLEKNLKSIGSEFGKHVEGDLQSVIHNKVQSLLKKWVELEEMVSKLCEEQIFVEKEWSEWFSLYDALSSWISSRQNEEMCSNLNRPYSVEEYELIMEELDINKCKF
ncbi:nesprin-1 [Trichonephila inaurata madagascariensis]|uniref:Nesprin-1 n=1 Tax=Trichonephila inaurata madagascariensis TaxID=2747483 RepID=A0A8X6WUI6_9ARAC|nr:nesprin-1 [Trichonephila inaurata madagascariensis]